MIEVILQEPKQIVKNIDEVLMNSINLIDNTISKEPIIVIKDSLELTCKLQECIERTINGLY